MRATPRPFFRETCRTRAETFEEEPQAGISLMASRPCGSEIFPALILEKHFWSDEASRFIWVLRVRK